MTNCCRVVLGKLTHVALLGPSALQALTLHDSLEAALPVTPHFVASPDGTRAP